MRRPTSRLQPANDAGIRFGWAEFDPRLSGGWASGSRQRRAADLLQRRRGRDPIRRGSLLTTPSSIAIISSHPVDCTKSAFALAGITSEQTRISSPSPSRFAPVARLSRSVLEPRSVRRSGARQKDPEVVGIESGLSECKAGRSGAGGFCLPFPLSCLVGEHRGLGLASDPVIRCRLVWFGLWIS